MAVFRIYYGSQIKIQNHITVKVKSTFVSFPITILIRAIQQPVTSLIPATIMCRIYLLFKLGALTNSQLTKCAFKVLKLHLQSLWRCEN